MDYSVSFSRHFARLLWLLVHESGNIDEQKAALRALVTISRDGPVRFTVTQGVLGANGAPVPSAFPGLEEFASRLAARSGTLHFDQGAAPALILGAARELAGGAPVAVAPEQARSPRVTTAFQAMGMIPAIDGAHDAPHASTAEAEAHDAAVAGQVSGLVAEAGADLFFQFAGSVPAGTPPEILARVDAARDADARVRAVDEVVLATEHAARDGRALVVGEFLAGLVEREAAAGDEARRTFTLAFRRVAKAGPLRAVAALLPLRPELRERHVGVLTRAGEEGADAVIEMLSQAQTAEDRRVFFDVLLRLNAGLPALLHMLGDPRWFVARNAAELLGEMGAAEAAQPLERLLHHADDRVRRAATESLLRLDTPGSLAAVEAVARQGAPAVRAGAIAALAKRRDGNTAATLVRALDAEGDEEVQLVLLTALGKVGSPDAIERLLGAAQPEGRFFRKKSAAFRAQAVLALGETRHPDALAAVRGYLEDREQEVKDAALRALALSRRSTGVPAPE
ncbi:MAG TPA: HEAT repeat domain-containing protein [Gemmatimonadaceae bacterium]